MKRDEHEAVSQQRRWANNVPVRRLSPKEGWTRGGEPARMLAPKGSGSRDLTSIRERNEIRI